MTSLKNLTLIIFVLLLSIGCTLHIGVSWDSPSEQLDGTEISKLIEADHELSK